MKLYFFRGLLAISLLCYSFTASADKEKPYATVAEAYVELHTGPGRGYPIFYVAERGEKILLLKMRTTWVKVRTERGKEGWVKLASIAKTLNANGEPITATIPQLDLNNRGNWEIGFMAGDFGGTDVVTAYTAYHFTKNLSLELAASENFGNVSSGSGATLSIAHQPFPKWRISPYFMIGGGVRKTEPRATLVSTEDRDDNVLAVGAGFRIYLARNFTARIQFKKHTILTNRDDDIEVEEWKIGLSAYF